MTSYKRPIIWSIVSIGKYLNVNRSEENEWEEPEWDGWNMFKKDLREWRLEDGDSKAVDREYASVITKAKAVRRPYSQGVSTYVQQ